MRREMQIDNGDGRPLDVSVAPTDDLGIGKHALPPIRSSIASGPWHLQAYLTPEEAYEYAAILTACAMEVETEERKAAEEDAGAAAAEARAEDKRTTWGPNG
jgi:hypothetical protein